MHWACVDRLVAAVYDPLSHGSAAAAPSGQKEPGVQALHAVPPESGWKEPSHCAHAVIRPPRSNVPGLHRKQRLSLPQYPG